MVNAKHDATSYESCSYQREIFDGNLLYDSFLKAKEGSNWKPQVHRFEMNLLFRLAEIQEGLKNGNYKFDPSIEFTLHERGKVRHITGETIKDRVAKHALCDEYLTPAVRKYLIYDNGASLQGRGIDFTRKRLLTHLRKYYHQHGSNDGYILLIDFSKYYDNIRHNKLMEQFRQYVKDEEVLDFLQTIIDHSKVDVSYMSDEEYANCMNTVFNSLEYEQIDKSLLTGEKLMCKHLNIGDQVAQVAGIIYPIPIDNYIKIVRGVKFYGRYMDDSYVIHEDKEYLEDLLKGIIEIANELGITVNTKKTRICKLSSNWRFLQTQYSLTDTGRIVQKINPKRMTAMRRKMKKLAYMLPPKEFEDWYWAWFKNAYKLMSKKQRENISKLYEELREVNASVQDHSKRRNRNRRSGTER